MRKSREILRLHRVAKLGVHSTVAEVLRRVEAAGISWPLPEGMDDAVLEAALYGPTALPPGGEHGEIAGRIAALLGAFVLRRGLGGLLVEAGFLLARNPDTVRQQVVGSQRRSRRHGLRLPSRAESNAYPWW